MGRAVLELDYLNAVTSKGRTYYYYRRGKRRIKLPNVEHTDFKGAYDKVHETFEHPAAVKDGAKPVIPGTFAALVADFKASADYTEKAPKTRESYKDYLGRMVDMWGDLLPQEISRAAAMKWRDELKDTPRTANYAMSVGRRLFYWAEDREVFKGKNPFRKPKRLKEGAGFQAWSDEQIQAYWEFHKADETRLLAAALGLFAGQRRGDVIMRNRKHWNGTEIVAVARKNAEPLWIHALPVLKALLEKVMPTRFMMLTTTTGRAFKERSFSRWFAAGVKDAGLPADCHFHGLRTTATEILCEFLTDAQLMAIFGWRDPKTPAHYRRNANKRNLALAGMKIWEDRLGTKSPS